MRRERAKKIVEIKIKICCLLKKWGAKCYEDDGFLERAFIRMINYFLFNFCFSFRDANNILCVHTSEIESNFSRQIKSSEKYSKVFSVLVIRSFFIHSKSIFH